MQYVLTDEFQAISETAGTLVNISTVAAEISLSPSRGTGIILFPRKHLKFNKAIYAARASGAIGRAIVAVIETQSDNSGGSSEFTQGDFEEVFGIGNFTQEDLEKVFSDS